jgi:hypothetical protein
MVQYKAKLEAMTMEHLLVLENSELEICHTKVNVALLNSLTVPYP